MVFEDDKAETLTEAMAALEQGLEEWFKDEGIGMGWNDSDQ
ncbi:MAG TPA: hypothetical protein VMV69_19120 [Pirellulales bacterium]|nr:hypothetical protein [Pirellulales bacterium]